MSERFPYNKLSISSIESNLRKIGDKCNVKIYPYKFRRTMATKSVNRGLPIQELKELMGHTKIETTMLYCNINVDNLKFDHSKYVI